MDGGFRVQFANCKQLFQRSLVMNASRFVLLAATGVVLALGRGGSAAPPNDSNPEKRVDEPFHKELLKAASEYKAWGRVDDEMRWAPWLCRMPNPGIARLSASKDAESHGQKLYSLFAKNRIEYLSVKNPDRKDKLIASGQTIVKQSWTPEEITDAKTKPAKRIVGGVIETPVPNDSGKRFPERDHFYPYAWKGDQVFKAAKQADLFIMLKLDPKTEGTDAGWIYGTVTPDGKKVTSAGKVESCIKCHQDAPRDRLFGLGK
jgi:hypothetical protein